MPNIVVQDMASPYQSVSVQQLHSSNADSDNNKFDMTNESALYFLHYISAVKQFVHKIQTQNNNHTLTLDLTMPHNQ